MRNLQASKTFSVVKCRWMVSEACMFGWTVNVCAGARCQRVVNAYGVKNYTRKNISTTLFPCFRDSHYVYFRPCPRLFSSSTKSSIRLFLILKLTLNAFIYSRINITCSNGRIYYQCGYALKLLQNINNQSVPSSNSVPPSEFSSKWRRVNQQCQHSQIFHFRLQVDFHPRCIVERKQFFFNCLSRFQPSYEFNSGRRGSLNDDISRLSIRHGLFSLTVGSSLSGVFFSSSPCNVVKLH